MDSIPNNQLPLPAMDSALNALKSVSAFKQETDKLIEMTQDEALTPPNLGSKVDFKA